MKRLLKYRNLLWVLVMVASFGNFLHAHGMEEKAIDEANYSFDTETNKSWIEINGDLNKKDVKNARKQARKEEREKRQQEWLAKRQEWQESNGDYRGNSEYYYPYYPYSHRSSYFNGYRYHASHNIFLFKLHPLDKHSLNVFGIDIVNQITEHK